MLMSCANVGVVRPDGTSYKYSRVGNQQINSFTIVDMTTGLQIQIVGQNAQNDAFVKSIVKGIMEGMMNYGRGPLQ